MTGWALWCWPLLTAVDHITVAVSDLTHAVATYRGLGFTLTVRESPGAAYAVFGDFYLEFSELAGEAEGLGGIALQSDDLDTDIARLRSSGVRVSDPMDNPVDGMGGSLSRRSASIDALVPVSLVEHRHASGDRLVFLGGRTTHPNTATALERTYLAVESIDQELKTFETVLGVPAPEPEMGTVIMSMMSVFYIGDIGIAVAEPRGPGPTADALEAGGPGLFQLLFRADHLDRAAGLMVDNGVPPPVRGTRLSGESALLVEPQNACNVYVAMAGKP